MRCPKCHYLSFEPEPRCRNCGYDLSFEPGELAFEPADGSKDARTDLDLHISHATPPGAGAELSLPSADRRRGAPAGNARVQMAPPAGSSTAPHPAGARSRLPSSPPPARTAELPLFVRGLPEPEPDQDEPLVKLPRAPRPPLSVRRPPPTPGRLREKYEREAAASRQVGLLERDLLEDGDRRVTLAATPVVPVRQTPDAPPGTWDRPVGAVRRIEAACLDALFIGAINIGVIWLTLQRCDLTLDQALLLPMLPIAAFLFLVDGGYLLLFTATNGQTIGKMAAGIRVVGTSSEAIINDRVTLKQAALRSVLTFPSVLALGAGFVPALTGGGLALHDRFAHTRVVRA